MRIYNTRLFTLSILVGLFAGIFGTAFRWILSETSFLRDFIFQHHKSLLFHIVTILGMWVVVLAVQWLTKHVALIAGSGIPQSRGVIFGRFTFKRPILQFVSKFIGSISAIGIGLSLGREGPSVQIGTLGATYIGNKIKTTPTEKRYLAAAGAGAGLSAAFTAPIASTIFLIEDTLGWVSLRIGLPALLACIAGSYCSSVVFPTSVYKTISTIFPSIPFVELLAVLVGFAILGALGGKLFNYTLFNLKELYGKLKVPIYIRLLSVVILTYIVGMFIVDLTAGGEAELIKQAISSNGSTWWLFAMVLIKIVFTALSYATGLCGSLLLPLIVLGGLLGKGYALILIQLGIISPENAAFFTIIGMSIFFISVVRAPISGLMLILEMTGQYHVFLPMIIAGTLTFLLGQYIGVKPVYHKLYQLMLRDEKKNYTSMIVADFEVSSDSILTNRQISEVKLPDGSRIINIYRQEEEQITLKPSDKLQVGDLLHIEIKEEDYEKLFKVFRSLTNE